MWAHGAPSLLRSGGGPDLCLLSNRYAMLMTKGVIRIHKTSQNKLKGRPMTIG